ncbi:MAG: YbbR-like domain-containing protein [Paenisporosarcina sp.]
MDKMMDNPWFLRITALLLAMLLFLTIKTGDENTNAGPSGSTRDIIRDVPIEVFYDDENLVVTGVPKTVDLTISGPSPLVQSAKQLRDFTVFLDLRNLNMGEHANVKLQIENVSDKLDVSLDPGFVVVNIEEKISREFDVEPELNDRLLAENFIVTSMKADPKTILVTGPKSVIESISFVKATVTEDQGINKTFTKTSLVSVLDSNLRKLAVVIEPQQVDVKVEIEEYSKEIPVTLKQTGQPLDGVTINDVETKSTTVRAFGSKAIIDELEEIIVDVDISKLEASKTFNVKIPIPEGVSRLSKEELEVKVDVTPVPVEEKTEEDSAQVEAREFANLDVEVRGLNKQNKASFIQPQNGQILLTVRGEDSYLNSLSIDDFKLYVDASDAAPGENKLDVKVEGPENVTWTVSIPIVTMQVERA